MRQARKVRTEKLSLLKGVKQETWMPVTGHQFPGERIYFALRIKENVIDACRMRRAGYEPDQKRARA
jgi:hypothetical protein